MTARSAVEGFFGVRRASPPGFAWSPSPANAGEDLGTKSAIIEKRLFEIGIMH
jgi:hypothetical protein